MEPTYLQAGPWPGPPSDWDPLVVHLISLSSMTDRTCCFFGSGVRVNMKKMADMPFFAGGLQYINNFKKETPESQVFMWDLKGYHNPFRMALGH